MRLVLYIYIPDVKKKLKKNVGKQPTLVAQAYNPLHRRLRQEDCKFKAFLGNSVRVWVKIKFYFKKRGIDLDGRELCLAWVQFSVPQNK